MAKQNKLPNIELGVEGNIFMSPDKGNLIYDYRPFYNLKMDYPIEDKDLTYLTMNADKAQIAIDSPIDIDIEESYDGSANLIINDRVNPLKIVNSRFYLTDSAHYEIGDRKGNLDTNIYTNKNFKIEANLIKSVQTVVGLDFLGLREGGRLPIGNYTFYFKLADSDGNESDFVSESGKVVCHIGNISQPKFIRGGQINENSGKSVSFRLKNLDLAYSFIHVYYTRTTGDKDQEALTAHKISERFKINGINTEIDISGYEETEAISIEDINIRYSEFNSTKTTENCQNMTFAGGVTNNYELFSLLEQYSLFVTPEVVTDRDIGNLSYNYQERVNRNNGYEYYNVDNIYYNLGYWDQEIYRTGIVYILNDYTLSPVFNTRGIKNLATKEDFEMPKGDFKVVNYQEDYIIENSGGLQNAKGVFKIDTNLEVFSGQKAIKPLGLKFNFHNDIVDGGGKGPGLQDITKGFFIVRQKRIPTILAQAVGAASTKKGNLPTIKLNDSHVMESFLSSDTKGRPRLGSSLVKIDKKDIINNVLLCPEADLRTEIYNSYFNSSEYTLIKNKYQPIALSGKGNSYGFKKSFASDSHFYLGDLEKKGNSDIRIKSSLLLVEPEISLIKNNNNRFSSKAGDAVIAHENVDVIYGDYSDPTNPIKDMDKYNKSSSKIRGAFNTYIGSDYNYIEDCVYYNIHQKDYDYDSNWKNYYKIRYNDSSPFFPISDRMEYKELTKGEEKSGIFTTPTLYRGDCYINTFTHRLNWNFIDPELPTNNRIVDRYTWHKNYRVDNKTSVVINRAGDDTENLEYNKLLPLFTFKRGNVSSFLGEEEDDSLDGLRTPENKRFKKYSERNGTFGYEKLNRPDINAVGLGQWVTYKICSNVNLAMRDVDLGNPSEEALHGMKRSFYPLQSIEKDLKLPESRIINRGISKTTGDRYYFEVPDVPFIKTHFPTRVFYSNVLQKSSFVNGNRVFYSKNYQDYSMEYGALVKLVEWYGTLMAVMEHGILQIPVNERAMMKNESGENVYINTDNVLPNNPKVLSNSFGSLWEDSIIKTSRYVYGLDTVGKKIWRTNGQGFEIISDLSIQQFLNDFINLKETDTDKTVGVSVIKTHYNAFKQDVLFTFKYAGIEWHICWNELLDKWVTRYSWYPEFSENINNIFYTFANKDTYKDKQGILYKHGFAGTLEEEGEILPTKWYDKQEPFEFEFVVAPNPGMQKIYNNFDIISNNVEPNSFIYEVVGDGYDWSDLKSSIESIGEETKMLEGSSSVFNYLFDFSFIGNKDS